MPAEIINGKAFCRGIIPLLKDEFNRLRNEFKISAKLAAVCVGRDDGVETYLKAQSKLAQDLGVEYEKVLLPEDVTLDDLNSNIERLNSDESIDGIILMQPLPERFDVEELILRISPSKDTEGLHPLNLGKIMLSKPGIVPPTAAAVMAVLDKYVKDYKGCEVVIIGHSHIVGKPLVLLLADRLATVRICHIGTSIAQRLKDHVKEADILIVATGVPGLVKGDWIKKGAIVIDVGINKAGDKIVGDVEFEKARYAASYISPVPGGIGPVTTVMLMKNLLSACKKRRGIEA